MTHNSRSSFLPTSPPLLLFLLFLLFTTTTASSSAIRDLLRSSSSSSPVVQLSPAAYREVVLDGPKGFHLVVLYTTADATVCLACQQVNEDFHEIGRNFAMDRAEEEEGRRTGGGVAKNKKNLSVFGSDGKSGDEVVFVSYDVLQDRDIALLHQISSIPMVVSVTSRSMKSSKAPNGKQILKFRSDDVYQIQGPTNVGGGGGVRLLTGSGGGLEWVNMKTTRNVAIQPPPRQQLWLMCKVVCLLCCLSLLGWFGIVLLKAFPSLLPLGALAVQLVSSSGLFFAVQNAAPLYGKAGWVSNSGRSQYLFEGLLMSAAAVLAAASLLLIVRIPTIQWFNTNFTKPSFGKKNEKKKIEQGGRKKTMEEDNSCWVMSAATSTAITNSIESGGAGLICWWWLFSRNTLKNVLLLVLMGVFLALVTSIMSVYKFKSPWYAPTFLPPADYVRGDLRADRGNEF
eukprot:GHVS01105657.1.p1 GENE.GHVS01105657.1~~GHVS01105657.1.p1  ORF type:complete len:455 (+),score=137.29 GHVS01105657.1:261-1625(+)